MSSPTIALVDYEMGNLRSVAKSLEKTGCRVRQVEGSFSAQKFDGLVLPGVGAFAAAMQNLKERKLWLPILKWLETGKPFLGICLGYQLLFEESEEVALGQSRKPNLGLGLFKGAVRRLPKKKGLKVPHIGWNNVEAKKSGQLFAKIKNSSYFYFDHSYVPVPKQQEIICGVTDYGGTFAAGIQAGSIFACQFHPEKSGENGLKLLRNFKNLC